MSLEHAEDAVRVAQALEGDPHAFDALMDQHYPSVYRLALHHIGDPDDAEDIAQETFFQAYVHLHTLDDGMRFSTWVLSIASNLSKNWIRCRDRRVTWDGARYEPWDTPRPLLDRRTPESEYIRREEQWLVFNALAGLPKEDRDLLAQFYLRGMSYQEIAEHLGISQQVVQGRLQAARDQLKGKIAGTVEEVLHQALSGRSFPTRLRIGRHSKNLRKMDIHTDPEDVFFNGIPRIIKVGSVYKAWVVRSLSLVDRLWIPFQVIHLTSQDGTHWTNRGPVLEVRVDPSSDRFDRYGIGGFCVLYDGSVYRMWYTGYMREQGGEQKIGYVISPDGLEWERISGPEIGGAVLDKGEDGDYGGWDGME